MPAGGDGTGRAREHVQSGCGTLPEKINLVGDFKHGKDPSISLPRPPFYISGAVRL